MGSKGSPSGHRSSPPATLQKKESDHECNFKQQEAPPVFIAGEKVSDFFRNPERGYPCRRSVAPGRAVFDGFGPDPGEGERRDPGTSGGSAGSKKENSFFEKGLFLYLYLLLDDYFRKAIHWLISWHLRALDAQRLIEGGLLAENILDLPENQRPEIINDRGCQMKAKSIQKMLEIHHMPQMFARPRTPNDNPFVESAFGTIKQSPHYPGRFLDLTEANNYFDRFFTWYNHHHYHSGIDDVTPIQCHQGLKETIVAKRKTQQKNQQNLRKKANPITSRLKYPSIMVYEKPIIPITCSVIPP